MWLLIDKISESKVEDIWVVGEFLCHKLFLLLDAADVGVIMWV